jgi:hypothetical protein
MLKGIPLTRELLNCRRQDYAEAAKEVVTTLAFSMLPFWLGTLIFFLVKRGSVVKFIDDFLASGEALLISAALIGPVIYVITKQYGDLPRSLTIRFPQGWLFVIVAIAICLITAAIVILQRVYLQVFASGNDAALFEAGLMRGLSLAIFIVTVSSLYLVTVLKNYTDTGAAAEMRHQGKVFHKEWRRR